MAFRTPLRRCTFLRTSALRQAGTRPSSAAAAGAWIAGRCGSTRNTANVGLYSRFGHLTRRSAAALSLAERQPLERHVRPPYGSPNAPLIRLPRSCFRMSSVMVPPFSLTMPMAFFQRVSSRGRPRRSRKHRSISTQTPTRRPATSPTTMPTSGATG